MHEAVIVLVSIAVSDAVSMQSHSFSSHKGTEGEVTRRGDTLTKDASYHMPKNSMFTMRENGRPI